VPPRPARGRGMRAGSYVSDSEHLRCGSGGQPGQRIGGFDSASPRLVPRVGRLGSGCFVRLRGTYRHGLLVGRVQHVVCRTAHVPSCYYLLRVVPRTTRSITVGTTRARAGVDHFLGLISCLFSSQGTTSWVGRRGCSRAETDGIDVIHPSGHVQPSLFPSPQQLSLRSLTFAVRCRSTCQP